MFHFPNFKAIMEDVKMGIKNLRTYLTREKVKNIRNYNRTKVFYVAKGNYMNKFKT